MPTGQNLINPADIPKIEQKPTIYKHQLLLLLDGYASIPNITPNGKVNIPTKTDYLFDFEKGL